MGAQDMTERYMIHLYNNGHTRHDAPALLRQARSLVEPSYIIRDIRIASSHIELDTTIPNRSLSILLRNISPLGACRDTRHVIEYEIPKDEAISEGIRFFNDERFWECHESFEGVWKGCYEGERDLVQGIILAAAGLVHYQKSQDQVCLSIFERALDKLSCAAGKYHGIDIDSLRRRLQEMVKSGRISTFDLV